MLWDMGGHHLIRLRRCFVRLGVAAACVLGAGLTGACSTAPPPRDQAWFIREAEMSVAWFKYHHPDIRAEMEASAGYIIFPAIDQWGYGIGGGRWGRGVVYRPDGAQLGWAAVSAACWGVQLGLQQYRMLLIFPEEHVLRRYQHHTLDTFVSGAGVAGEAGHSTHDPLASDDVSVYHASNAGLMVGVNVGVELMRYEPAPVTLAVRPATRPGERPDVN